jgi:phenylalanyl-tRNA synthetase alpha chain
MSPTHLRSDALARDLSIRDLTDPAQGPHALQPLLGEIISSLQLRWPETEVRLVRGDRVVTLADNYWHLGYAADAVTVDSRYTRYVDEGHVLRSHSSALIPPALRALAEKAPAESAGTDVLLVCPGICYRRDAVDRLHTGTPHQVDLWRITNRRSLDEADLEDMIAGIVSGALPGASWRTVATGHPYTTGGRQIDAAIPAQSRPAARAAYGLDGDGWVEIGECGLAAPAVLSACGLPADRSRTGECCGAGAEYMDGPHREWTGLAMGLGLDRLLMLRKGIPDIRLLRSSDPRIATQLLDLRPYQAVSTLPPIRRDVSVAVDAYAEISAETLGDQVREALGADADAVESVSLLAVADYADVPELARERLEMRPGQRNLLVRIVLRPWDRTLTDAEANALRDRIYAALHHSGRPLIRS